MAGTAGPGVVEALRRSFEEQANAGTAAGMSKYMRDQFPFLGLKAGTRRALQRPLFLAMRRAKEGELLAVAGSLWVLPEREYQYAAVDLLAGAAPRLATAALEVCERLITVKPWWDTVDGLAAQVTGVVVLGHREQATVMDRWLASESMWLRRAAIIHQLKWKEETDTERLFRYCLATAGEREFFIRKAIGWALRQYSWTNPEAVRAFVMEHEGELSGLSRREAMLVVSGGRQKPGPGAPSKLDEPGDRAR